jgi:hypothetical protein
MRVGYNSQDPTQIHRQISDMISRGIDGIVIDWYGSRDTFTNTATLRIMKEVEQHPGFTFAIMVDKGAIKLSSCSGCTPQQALIEQLRYVEKTFVPSHAYMRINGRPVITNFDLELRYPVDWKAAAAALSTHPVLLFEDSGGFTHEVTGGSYSWVRPSTKDLGMAYMANFYDTGLNYPRLHTVGASYKGFDDTLASWSLNRIMPQHCGQTWLKTFAKANSMCSSSLGTTTKKALRLKAELTTVWPSRRVFQEARWIGASAATRTPLIITSFTSATTDKISCRCKRCGLATAPSTFAVTVSLRGIMSSTCRRWAAR